MTMKIDYDWFVRALPREQKDLARYLFVPSLMTMLEVFNMWLECQKEDLDMQLQCGVERVLGPTYLRVVGVDDGREVPPARAIARAWIRAVDPESGGILFTAAVGGRS